MIRNLIRKWLKIDEYREEKILVKYHSDYYLNTPLTYTGDWVDVRACDGIQSFNPVSNKWVTSQIEVDENGDLFVEVLPHELVKVPLGFSLKLPKNYEAILKVRSSTSKNTGLLMATSGVIDEGYCGNDDMWFGVYSATRKSKIYLGERISQFRIQEKQPKLKFITVSNLGNKNRGGHGSTGRF